MRFPYQICILFPCTFATLAQNPQKDTKIDKIDKITLGPGLGRKPSRAERSRAEPSRAGPGRAELSQAKPEPNGAGPSRAETSRAGPGRSRAEPSRSRHALCRTGLILNLPHSVRSGRSFEFAAFRTRNQIHLDRLPDLNAQPHIHFLYGSPFSSEPLACSCSPLPAHSVHGSLRVGPLLDWKIVEDLVSLRE